MPSSSKKIFNRKVLKIAIERHDLELNKQFHNSTQKFLRFIEASCQSKKFPTTLQSFYTLEFGEFIKELKKQKVKLSKQDEFELLALLKSQKSQALRFQQQIEQTDHEIDRMVYDLYDLTEEEILMVEGNGGGKVKKNEKERKTKLMRYRASGGAEKITACVSLCLCHCTTHDHDS